MVYLNAAATTIIGVMIFLASCVVSVFLNNFNGNWLYVQPFLLQKETDNNTHNHQWHQTSSKNEYLWMLVTQGCILLSSVWVMTGSGVSTAAAGGRQGSAAPVVQGFGNEKQAWRAFLIMNVSWYVLAIATAYHKEDSASRSRLDVFLAILGGKAAWPAMWNLALVLFPMQRFLPWLNNAHSGIAQQTRGTQLWHIWCGHACVVWLLLHTILLSCQYYIYRAEGNFHDWWILMTPYHAPIFTEGHVNFAGWISLGGLILLWVASRPFVKQPCYEVFFVGHIIGFLVFVFFANLHDYNVFFFLQPSLATHAVDWIILRRTSSFRVQIVLDMEGDECQPLEAEQEVKAIVRGSEPSFPVIQLSLPIPSSWPKLEPGMFVKLFTSSSSSTSTCSNGRSRRRLLRHLEPSHSFSIGHISADHFIIYIKNLGDWTNSLIIDHFKQCLLLPDRNDESVLEDDEPASPFPSTLSLNIEGPYGGFTWMPTLEACERRIFLVGGVGMAGMAPFLQTSPYPNDGSDRIYWWLNTTAEYQIMATLLRGVEHKTQIYITKEHEPSLRDSSISTSLITKTLSIKSNHRSFSHRTQPIRTKKDVSVVAALMGASTGLFLSMFLARLGCQNESYHIMLDLSGVGRYHTCSLFSRTGEKCVPCDTPDGAEAYENLSCCPSISCYYCFRGLPMMLSLLLVPLGVLFFSYAYRLFSQRLRQHELVPVTDTDATNDSPRESSSLSLPFSSYRPGGEVSTPKLDFIRPSVRSIIESLSMTSGTVVVVCGPRGFVRDVQEACPTTSRLLVVNHPS